MKIPAVVLSVCMGLLVLGASAQSTNPGAGIDPALLAKAAVGDADAQLAIGDLYAAGNTVPRDLKQAAEWYLKAAEQGNITAEINLADAYRDGRGVTRDKAQAALWYRKAADQGDASAQGTLAMLYVLGQGVPQSDVEAYFWFDLAASTDSARKQQYITNRQNIGTRITADELEQVQDRVAKWKAAHKR